MGGRKTWFKGLLGAVQNLVKLASLKPMDKKKSHNNYLKVKMTRQKNVCDGFTGWVGQCHW
jgi:hypothetical protein